MPLTVLGPAPPSLTMGTQWAARAYITASQCRAAGTVALHASPPPRSFDLGPDLDGSV